MIQNTAWSASFKSVMQNNAIRLKGYYCNVRNLYNGESPIYTSLVIIIVETFEGELLDGF